MRGDFNEQMCNCPRCKLESVIVGYIQGHVFGLCQKHWLEHCAVTENTPVDQWAKGGPNGPIEERIANRR